MPDSIADTYQYIRQRLGTAELVAVSKRQPLEKMQALYALGQRVFAENYVQEGVDKINALSWPDVQWHFIGQIQSNKTKLIATQFDWVQSLDRLKIAERLNEHCQQLTKTLQVCVAVNIDDEPQKGGVLPDAVYEFVKQLRRFGHLQLRGIMVLPKARHDYESQKQVFDKTKQLFDELNQQGCDLDTLSMGMSGDFEAAVAAGSTMVRIGTLLFGSRE